MIVRAVAAMACGVAMILGPGIPAAETGSLDARLRDQADGRDWPAFGRTYGEQHFSPLDEINARNVGRLGLAWSLDLPVGNSVTGPVVVDGVIYIARGYSVVHAIDAASGRELWVYDPKAPEAAGRKLRFNWGSRGIAWWNGKVYTGTVDGRLIAIDAKTGRPVWSVLTVDPKNAGSITGPPRVFDGKVIIGQSGADFDDFRGYVTTYDAETGRQLWRFHLVPGNPAEGFESPAMEMAAKTWSGEWWKYGGGGNVWNAFTYDAETGTIILGTGNGSPWNHRIRSNGVGDNLFLCSIVALDADTGAYKWHYQVNPAETWDYNSSTDMQLADLKIGGRTRKVLMTAPKNGFFYVIDRMNGKLISAEPIVPVSWATHIDLKTGRPAEVRGARYPDGSRFLMKPGPMGAHTWLPMAYSPQTRLAYIPAIELMSYYDDVGIDVKNWKRWPGYALDGGLNATIVAPDEAGTNGTSSLLAWDPVAQKKVWQVPTPAFWNGGVLATGGDLVFQGQIDDRFNAYDAKSGTRLWSFDTGGPVLAPPVSYAVNGRQYVTVLTGVGTGGGALGPLVARFGIDYRTQARRVLTFVLDGNASLPMTEPPPLRPVADPGFRPDAARAAQVAERYGRYCTFCHGVEAISAGVGPDLRASAVPLDAAAFASVVRDGALVARGMPRFEEFTDGQLDDLRHYLRTQAAKLREAQPPGAAGGAGPGAAVLATDAALATHIVMDQSGGRPMAEATQATAGAPGDIEAIRNVLTLYAKSLDRRDFAAMKRVFTPDATGNYHESGSYQGVETLSAFFAKVLGQCGPTQHLLGSMDIQVQGDRATASTYLQAIHIGSKPGFEGKRLTVWGEYRDQLVRTAEGWRIRHRELVPIHAEGDAGISF